MPVDESVLQKLRRQAVDATETIDHLTGTGSPSATK